MHRAFSVWYTSSLNATCFALTTKDFVLFLTSYSCVFLVFQFVFHKLEQTNLALILTRSSQIF